MQAKLSVKHTISMQTSCSLKFLDPKPQMVHTAPLGTLNHYLNTSKLSEAIMHTQGRHSSTYRDTIPAKSHSLCEETNIMQGYS